MGLIELLVYVIVLGVVFYLLFWAVAQIPLPPPFAVVAKVLLVLIVVLVLLNLVFGFAPMPALRWRQ